MSFFFVLVDLLISPTARQRLPGCVSWGSGRVALGCFPSTAVLCAGQLLSRAGIPLHVDTGYAGIAAL